jgi:hypothetical protein
MRGKSNVSCDGAMPSIRRYHGQSPARLSNIDRRQLSAAYPQSQKREIWPVQQRLAAHEFTGVNLGGPPPEKFKLSHLQRSLSTPINHCGGNTASRCALEHTRRPAAPPFAASKPGSFGARSTLQTHNATERNMIARRRWFRYWAPQITQRGDVWTRRAKVQKAARARHRTASRATAGSRPAPVPSQRL